MTNSRWTRAQLKDFDTTENLTVRFRGGDGQLGQGVPVWVVVAEDRVYVRAYQGTSSRWFRRAIRAGAGAVVTNNTEELARFEPGDNGARGEIDAAYRVKYGRFGYVSSVLTDSAAAATIRIDPQSGVHSGPEVRA